MKKCPKCGKKFSDNIGNCTKCGEVLEEYKSRIDAFYEKPKRTKNIIIGLMLVASFVFGSSLGVEKAEYNKLQTEYQELQSKYETSTKNYEKLTAEKKALDSEYKEYKEKMQPYEAQREADIKAAEEKKVAEEKAKKEAEEKAKKEAEEQARKAAEAEAAKQAKAERQSQAASNQNQSYTVYVTNTGAKYHSSGCQYLRKSKIAISKDRAVAQGYSACSRCSP